MQKQVFRLEIKINKYQHILKKNQINHSNHTINHNAAFVFGKKNIVSLCVTKKIKLRNCAIKHRHAF